MLRLAKNNNQQPLIYDPVDLDRIKQFHNSLPGYQPTELIALQNLAQSLQLKSIHVKDESTRFGLKAFKGMGASYAIYRFIKKKFEQRYGVLFSLEQLYDKSILSDLNLPPLCTATDGNHGRAVAWMARLLGLPAVIYIPDNTVSARIENIKKEGAEVIIVKGGYDETVKRCAADAEQFGYQVIADTAYDDYTEIPQYITEGYLTLLDEIDDKLKFDYIFVQCGVGSFAAAVVIYYKMIKEGTTPKIVLVEPTNSACVYDSFVEGNISRGRGSFDTIMAGLNCGTPSTIAWPVLRDGVDYFLTVDDSFAEKAMRQFYYPLGEDRKIVSGESGSAGLAALLVLNETGRMAEIGLDQNSKVLLFNTEGDTDPENFQKIITRTHR